MNNGKACRSRSIWPLFSAAQEQSQSWLTTPVQQGPLNRCSTRREEFVESNPILHELVSDVEALLVNRVRGACEYYIVPIDACYRLVGLIRLSWRGLGGGTEVWEAIAGFFQEIQAKAQPVRGGKY